MKDRERRKHRGHKEKDREDRDREDRHRIKSKTHKSGHKVKKSAKAKFRGAANIAVAVAHLQKDQDERDKKSPLNKQHRHMFLI